MAIYHLRLTQISRSDGHHAVNSAAYRRGVEMMSVDGEVFNWSKKQEEVIHSNILVPDSSPLWVENIVSLEIKSHDKGSEQLWNLVEQTENRKDAQLFYEFEVALPKELEKLQQIELIDQFAKEYLTKRGMIVDYSIHHISGNPHAHIACTTREITKNGFGKKVREWKNKSVLYSIREGWAASANYALRKAGIDILISHESYKAQGLDFRATIHEGAARYIGAEGNLAFKYNDEIRKANFENILSSPALLIKKIATERETFTRADLMAEFMRHAPTGKDFTPQIRAQMLQAMDSITPNFGMTKDKLCIEIDGAENDNAHDIIQQIFNDLHATKSVFTEYDLARAANVATQSAEQFGKVYEELKKSIQLINLGPGEDGKIRFTTYEAFELENAIQLEAETLNDRNGHKVANQIAKKYAAKYKLNQEQTEALKHILTGNDLTAIVGYAGTGKSYLLGCAREAWEHAGFNVQGIALAGIAAEGLERDAKIPSRTIELFRYSIKEGFITLTSRDIVVMDEAGMTDNLAFAAILNAVSLAKAKLVIVGDDAQLTPIGPGAAFRAIIERIGCAILGDVIRQKEVWQRQATVEFAKNFTEDALSRYQEKGYIKLLDTTEFAKQQLINDWLETIQSKPINKCLILAFKNDDVNDLNKAAREKLIQTNKLSTETIDFATKKGVKEFRIGERIIFLKNKDYLGVKNGRRGMVVGFDHGALHVHLDGDGEKIITIDAEQYNQIDYGYASTVHKTQGMTVLDSFVLAAGRWSKNLTYVAMSRHKENAYLYGGKDFFASIDKLKQHMSRWDLKDTTLDFPIQFMLRRGFGVDGTAANFSSHWQNKLSSFFAVVENYVSPDTYYHKLAMETKAKEMIERRERAKIVGIDYIDARAKARDAYLALEKVGVHLGITETENFALFKKLEEHPALEVYRSARDIRNELASNIYKNKDSLTRALELNAINIEHLEKYAKQHKFTQNVKDYLEYLTAGKVIWQDKLAYTIQNDIKAHYRSLKELKVDTKLLKEHSNQHEIRTKLKILPPEVKIAIRAYKAYQQANKKAAEAWQIISSNNDSGYKTIRNMLVYANNLTAFRNQVAFEFVQHQQANQALELFNIKQLDNTAKETLTEQEMWQQQKLERLYNYAEKHAALQRVKNFLIETRVRQEKIAVEICAFPKLHHGAICANTTDPQSLWREIRQLAEFNKIHEFKMQLPWDLRVCFDEVQKYVAANRALGCSLAELAETKKLIEIPAEIMSQIAEYGKTREAIAYKINNNLTNYQPALEFFKISPDKISALALREEARLRVLEFKQSMGNIEHKAHLAQTITADPQLHYGIAKELGINFLKFYPYAGYADKLDKLTGLSKEEQADFRLVSSYKQLFRKAGKYWANQAKTEGDNVINWEAVHQGQVINSARDVLAAQIYNNPDRFGEIQHLVGGNFDKLSQHAESHLRRKDEVTHYLTAREQLIEITEKVKAQSQVLPKNYQLAWSNNVKEGYRLNRQPEKYNAVFKELNISTNDFGWYTPTLAVNENSDIASPNVGHEKQNLQDDKQQKHYDLDIVNSVLASNARNFATELLGTPTKRSSGQQLYFGSKNGSLCVTIQGNKAGLWHDFASGEGGNLVTLVQRELGLSFKEAIAYCAHQAGMLPSTDVLQHKNTYSHVTKKEVGFTEKQLEKIALANNMAQGSKPITNTCVEKYLLSRGIKTVNTENIKYGWAYEPEHGKKERALCCFAKNNKGEIQSVQAIYLSSEGRKLDNLTVKKRTYGPTVGAACLVNEGNNKETIYLAEGPETAMSVAQAELKSPVYTTFGVSNFANMPLTKETKKVVLCADNDGKDATSYKSTMEAAMILLKQGVEVFVTKPRYKGQDFNDVLQYFGVNKVIEIMQQNMREIKLENDYKIIEVNAPLELTLAEQFIENRQEIARLAKRSTIPELAKELKYRAKLELELAKEIKNNNEELTMVQTKGYSKELDRAYDEYQLVITQSQGIHRSR